jgi:hypothetical protein
MQSTTFINTSLTQKLKQKLEETLTTSNVKKNAEDKQIIDFVTN